MTPSLDVCRLFPVAPPFDEGWLAIDGEHRIYYSQRGNPHGIPALVIHGGPGSGGSAQQARFFNPARFRVIQFDQRGSGCSEPAGEIRDNTTELLVQDIDVLRRHLAIDRWLVTGGSWGAALGAVYAARYRADVTGVLLRGLFLAQQQDNQWFFQNAASAFPAAWSTFSDAAPADQRRDLLSWLHALFVKENDTAAQIRVARRWYEWEQTLGGVTAIQPPDADTLNALCRRYRVQSHYLVNQCWLGSDAVVAACAQLGVSDLPVRFVHGALDRVCPIERAMLAHKACVGSLFDVAAGAGHDPFHADMITLMRKHLDWFVQRG